MTKLFSLKKQKEETSVENQTRTSIVARKKRVQMKLLFLFGNDERRSRKPHKMGAHVGLAESKECVGHDTTFWAGEKDWMKRRKEQTSPRDKCKFITYILNKMKFSTEHKKAEKKDGEKRLKKKTTRDLGPGDTTVHTRER